MNSCGREWFAASYAYMCKGSGPVLVEVDEESRYYAGLPDFVMGEKSIGGCVSGGTAVMLFVIHVDTIGEPPSSCTVHD